MAAIRSLSSIAQKWQERASSASNVYAAGVQSPKSDWAAQTAAAAGNWEAGVTEAARNKSFGKGVQAAGTPKWQQKSVSKGAPRYAPGVADALPDYSKGFEKFRQVIESTQLPPRFAKGDPRNIERVRTIASALRKAKVSA